jgi:hypothetical protein
MGYSPAVAVRKAAIAALDALIDDDEVLVNYYWKPDARDRRQVFTQRSRADVTPAAMKAGRLHRNEAGRFELVVHLEHVGEDQEAADEEVLDAYAEIVEEYFADTKRPDVEGVNWWLIASWELAGGPSDRGSISQLIYTITYDARVT